MSQEWKEEKGLILYIGQKLSKRKTKHSTIKRAKLPMMWVVNNFQEYPMKHLFTT